jgi:hypothetical protein
MFNNKFEKSKNLKFQKNLEFKLFGKGIQTLIQLDLYK